MLVLVLGIVVAVGCVVVDTDKGAVVDARNMRFKLKLPLDFNSGCNVTISPFSDFPLT